MPPPQQSPAVAPTTDPHAAVIDACLSSGAYRRAREAGGRAALPDTSVRQVLRLLLAGGGRAPGEQVARALGVPYGRLPMAMAGLRRLLNVEGYPVVSMDADGRTVVLDEPLWRQQFGLGT